MTTAQQSTLELLTVNIMDGDQEKASELYNILEGHIFQFLEEKEGA